MDNNIETAIPVPARLVTKKSSKGSVYRAIELELCPTYTKLVFLERPEEALINLMYTSTSSETHKLKINSGENK